MLISIQIIIIISLFNLIFLILFLGGGGRGSCVSFKDLLSDSTVDQVNKLLQS
jgi:hypothetical protein